MNTYVSTFDSDKRIPSEPLGGKKEEQSGEYQTKRLVVYYFDAFQENVKNFVGVSLD